VRTLKHRRLLLLLLLPLPDILGAALRISSHNALKTLPSACSPNTEGHVRGGKYEQPCPSAQVRSPGEDKETQPNTRKEKLKPSLGEAERLLTRICMTTHASVLRSQLKHLPRLAVP